MSLTFILGGAGTGKTWTLLHRLIASAEQNPRRRHIILVPEQFTMQTQRDVVAFHPRHAAMNIDILSFERLAHRVLQEVGCTDVHILTDMGKNMLLRKAAGAHRDELSVFRRQLGRPGFVSRLMSMISELYQYGISEEDLASTLENMSEHPLLMRKLADLQVFYHALNMTRGEGTIAAEELLSVLERVLPQSSFLRDAVIALDGFTGFTPVQYQIIRQILCQTRSVSIALVLPREEAAEEAREQDLFYMSKIMLYRCRALAAECGIPTETVFLTEGKRFAKRSALQYLERHFLRLGQRAKKAPAPDGIQAVLLRNPTQEASYAAAQIQRLVREKGYRYREIAVVTGDMDEYRPCLASAFGKAKIPCFMDRKVGLFGNPLVEYLRSALEVLETDFSYEAVFRHLKCGVGPLTGDALDALDNYALACGLRGRKKWEQPFETVYDRKRVPDFAALNESRLSVLADLEPLLVCRREKRELVQERTEALRQMMEESGAAERLEELAALAESRGESELAEECRKVYDFLLDFLGQMDGLLGEEKLSWQEFSDILDAGLGEARLGMLPPGLDLVQVGDVRRSRLSGVKVLLLLGLNDGLIPKAAASGGLLSEQERALLREYEMELAPTAEQTAYQDRFYLYMLLTKPSERLILTCSKMGNDGNARRMSYLLQQLMKLFPELVLTDGEETGWRERITGLTSAWEVLADLLRENGKGELTASEREFLHCMAGGEDAERYRKVLDAAFAFYEESSISAAAARALYGPELTGSVTRLEQYAACACAQFLSFGLQLTERRENTFTGANRGSFFHKVLEEFFHLLKEREIDRRTMTEAQRKEFVTEAVERAFDAEGAGLTQERAGNRYLMQRWTAMADRSIWAICRQLAEGDFEPEEFELYFDGWSSPSMRFSLTDTERMILRGVVDRLDVYETDDKRYVKIIDYKTGNVRLDLNAIAHGLQLQLLIYLEAVMEMQKKRFPDREIVPAGLYYYAVQNPILDSLTEPPEEEREQLLLREMQMRGMTNDSKEVTEHQEKVGGESVSTGQFETLRRHVRKKVQQFGREMMEGNVSALPYRRGNTSGCDFCAFSGICGFDPKIDGYHFRRLADTRKKELWEKLEREGGASDGSEMDAGTKAGH